MKILAFHIQYELPIALVETIEELAWELNCLCIGHEPPHEDAWPAETSDLPQEGTTIVKVSFISKDEAIAFAREIEEKLDIKGSLLSEEVDDWLVYHRPFAEPILLKTLTIAPEEAPSVADQDQNKIYLPPGLGFGTGRHETTRSCLLLLEDIDQKERKTAIDFGCGSGILAIAALRLGTEHVQYHDHDPQAMRASEHNIEAHGYSDKTEAKTAASEIEPADLLMANILWEPLNHLCEILVSKIKPQGLGLFSGLLDSQEELFLKRYSPFMECIHIHREGQWIGILMKKI